LSTLALFGQTGTKEGTMVLLLMLAGFSAGVLSTILFIKKHRENEITMLKNALSFVKEEEKKAKSELHAIRDSIEGLIRKHKEPIQPVPPKQTMPPCPAPPAPSKAMPTFIDSTWED
jgi:hypothetical protein